MDLTVYCSLRRSVIYLLPAKRTREMCLSQRNMRNFGDGGAISQQLRLICELVSAPVWEQLRKHVPVQRAEKETSEYQHGPFRARG